MNGTIDQLLGEYQTVLGARCLFFKTKESTMGDSEEEKPTHGLLTIDVKEYGVLSGVVYVPFGDWRPKPGDLLDMNVPGDITAMGVFAAVYPHGELSAEAEQPKNSQDSKEPIDPKESSGNAKKKKEKPKKGGK